MHYITSVFRKLLELKGTSLFLCDDDELDDMINYCRNYLDCKLEDYRRIWYTLHTTQDAVRWPNLLIVSELLFSLPFTNTKVEKSFSHLKVIKSERCTSRTLDDLLEINIEGPPFESFSAGSAVDLWWAQAVHRPNQKSRKDYRSREGSSSSTDDDSLDDWDQWFNNNSE